MSFGLAGALFAALAYGAATVLQALGVRRFADVPAGTSWAARLWVGRLYAAGLAVDGAGFLASVLALRTLPLFVVESAVASSVAVTAVLSAVVLKQRLSRREIAALVVIGIGLVALASSAREGSASRPAHLGAVLLASVLIVALVLAAGWRSQRHGVALLSVAAGLGFGGLGIAARVLVLPAVWWHVVTDPALIALVAHGILSTTAYALALERGKATTVAAVTVTIETVVPALVGLAWLGDGVRHGSGWVVVAVLAFAATVGGSIALAGRAEPASRAEDAESL